MPVGRSGGQFRGRVANITLYVLTALCIYLASVYLLDFYVDGDQTYYHEFYENLRGETIGEIPYFQFIYTGSAEPLYGVLMWIGANAGIDKNVLISVCNALLGIALLKFLISNRASTLFTLLVFTNFYFLVLLTGAERLKFAYIAMIFALISESRLTKAAFLMSAPFFHFQSFIFIASWQMRFIKRVRFRQRISSLGLLLGILCIPIFAFAIYKYLPQIFEKLAFYGTTGGIFDVVNIVAISGVAFVVFRKKVEALLVLSLCAFFAVMLGSERINMVAVSLFLLQAIRERRTAHPLVLLIMVYFSHKSINFVNAILLYGDGFSAG